MTLLSRFRALWGVNWWSPKPRRVNKVPPDEERCIAFTKRARTYFDRCKFRRKEGERCSIHQKMWEREKE